MAAVEVESDPVIASLLQRAKETPDKSLIVAGKQRRSYAETLAGANAVATWLDAEGHRSGEPVFFAADSTSTHFPSLYFGIHLRNGIAVPVDARATEAQELRLRDFVGPGTGITGDKYSAVSELIETAAERPVRLGEPTLPTASDACEIIFTTGTTGKPKGVLLSHKNTSASASLIRQYVGNESNDVEVVTVPLTHSFGIGRIRSTVLAGGTVVLVPGLTFPQLVINALRDEEATGLIAVPTGMEILLRSQAQALAELSTQIRYIEMGSAPMRKDSKKQLCRLLPNTRICMHYGMTEASRSAFIEFHSDFGHLDTVGRPSPGVEIAILSEDSIVKTPGHSGPIAVRADTVMSGYWKDPVLSRRVLRPDGWLVTSDEGQLDESGYLTLIGRLDDVINTGAEKIRAEQLENVVRRFEGVIDCACTGIPDPDGILGELPLICIEGDPESVDKAALTRFVLLESDRKVQKAEIRFVDRLPRTESGKLLRKSLPTLNTL